MEEIINKLETTITEIRKTINEGIENSIENGSDLTEDDKLKDDAPLVDYIGAITKLKANITQAGQQIIILYTYAESKDAAEKKKPPTISWKKNENGEYVIEYSEFNPSKGVPSGAIQQDPTHKLGIRFASITKDADDADFGEPIQMTGDRGEKGEKGEPGTDAVIFTQIHRLVKLYCVSPSKPQVPTFYKDTGFDLHRKFKNELDANRIYYEVGGSKTYINDPDSNGHTSISQNNIDVGEIEVDINSKDNKIEVLSEPIIKTISIKNTKTEFAVNNNDSIPPIVGGSESRPQLSIDAPCLGSKTAITFNNGAKTENISLIQQLPTVIKGITTLYLATPDTKQPDGEESGGSEEIPILGPVIGKKEIVEYTSEIGGENSSTKITITPISIQGESGIKFIGSVESPDDLSQAALQWEDSYIGRMGVLVGKNTYIGYGTSEPVPSIEGIKKIGANYGLDLGQIHVCDGAAKEGESGYIQNRTHYVDTFKGTFGSNPGDLPVNASNIKIGQGSRSGEYLYPSQINERIKDPNSPSGTFSSPFKGEDNQILSMITPGEYEYSYEITHTLDPKFIPTTIIEITYNNLKWLRDEKQLIPGRQYRITDYKTTTTQENTSSADHQFDIIVTALNEGTLSEEAKAIQHDGDEYFVNSNLAAWKIGYSLNNDAERFAWADVENGKGVIYYMKDEHNNECPYDFKNIKFSHGDDWMYTFSVGNGAEGIDYTVIDSDELPISNTIKGNLDFSRRLYKNIFYNTDPDYFSPPIGNYIGQNSQSCILINDCQYNVIEDRVINVELYNAYSNKIESGSSEIRIDDSVYNTIGKGCRWITIINDASAGAPDDYGRNNFLTNCHYIELKNCDYNTFGHNCHGRDEQSVWVTNCKYCHCMNGVEFINNLTNKTGQIINYPGN